MVEPLRLPVRFNVCIASEADLMRAAVPFIR